MVHVYSFILDTKTDQYIQCLKFSVECLTSRHTAYVDKEICFALPNFMYKQVERSMNTMLKMYAGFYCILIHGHIPDKFLTKQL